MSMGKFPRAALLVGAGLGLAFVLGLASARPLIAQTATLPCAGAERPRQVAELLFGRNVGRHRGVSNRAFAHFVANELTPRFPDGLTITDATGQWRDPAGGAIVHEATKLVEIVLPGGTDDQAKLDAVVTDYKREFHQQSVGVVVQWACVSF
jgi:hypothetical protein